MASLLSLITSSLDEIRNQSLDQPCAELSLEKLLDECTQLDQFRREAENLYQRVRALLFLYSIHRYHIPKLLAQSEPGTIPYHGYQHFLNRRFEEAIDVFLKCQLQDGPSDGISSALASTYQRLAFQTLADQVKRSVRCVRGNQWMFRMGHPADHPLEIRSQLLTLDPTHAVYPILRERTPVRMDLTHCGWSDIFFLGMDYPEGAKVLNVSIDLAIHGKNDQPMPPVEACLRVIDQPVLRLTSVDLECSADITSLNEVFDFAKDHLGLLKAAIIASGIVPPGIEGSGQKLSDLLEKVLGPNRGLELVSNVNNIPKGSRLAVSTNLLAALISACMRATGQTQSLTGPLLENERRLVLARALLGEWIGGSGGGWQDSGGVWPGIKMITGAIAENGDPEFGISRGRLMPKHHILSTDDVPASAREALQASLVLVHGGMAQNVGPILEMVTEKYLLRAASAWQARLETHEVLDDILQALQTGDIKALGAATTRNFMGPIQTIIPWASNLYTETILSEIRQEMGEDFWGFWMLGGMSGGGMGFIFAPHRKAEAQQKLLGIMLRAKSALCSSLPFAMDPVVYDFSINENGTTAELQCGNAAMMPIGYYSFIIPNLLSKGRSSLPPRQLAELNHFATACRTQPKMAGMKERLFDAIFPDSSGNHHAGESLDDLLTANGFDRTMHEQIGDDLKAGRIGLAQNRLAANSQIEDVLESDVLDGENAMQDRAAIARGERALADGSVAVVTLAAGAGTRWTQGAGVVKALNPFCRIAGKYRSFIEVHLAKSRRTSRLAGHEMPHVFTTSHFSHQATQQFLDHYQNFSYTGPLALSPGKSIGLRMVPTQRDMRFAWEEMAQQVLDVQQQKVRDSVRSAWLGWAEMTGEASDYTDNLAHQCIHPVGHWYEVPNMLQNGVLAKLLDHQPQLQTLVLHNIDTVGMHVDPGLLGCHLGSGAALTFEMITRRLDDRGGGLARVNGRVHLIEGLALPREEDEFHLTYYNSNTCWIQIDALLDSFSLGRADLRNLQKVQQAIRRIAAIMPTYITLKDVKKRWGRGQEDVYPVCQFEKLWVDMSQLSTLNCQFMKVPRQRGQQLKDPAQLDGWLRDGSASHLESLGDWS